MDHLRCVVERITYQNNDYSVIKCRAKNYSDLVTVVGSMAEVHVGSVLSIEGFWKVGFDLLQHLLDGDYSDMEGFEWL